MVFDHAAKYLNPGGVLFGSTLLQRGVRRSVPARWLMAAYNRNGTFSNTEDDLDGLRSELARRYPQSYVKVVGCAALFWGRKPADSRPGQPVCTGSG